MLYVVCCMLYAVFTIQVAPKNFGPRLRRPWRPDDTAPRTYTAMAMAAKTTIALRAAAACTTLPAITATSCTPRMVRVHRRHKILLRWLFLPPALCRRHSTVAGAAVDSVVPDGCNNSLSTHSATFSTVARQADSSVTSSYPSSSSAPSPCCFAACCCCTGSEGRPVHKPCKNLAVLNVHVSFSRTQEIPGAIQRATSHEIPPGRGLQRMGRRACLIGAAFSHLPACCRRPGSAAPYDRAGMDREVERGRER